MTIVPELSVIVPTCNRRDLLSRLLNALNRQTIPPQRYEVIVSVDGSTDGTTEMLSALAPGYRLRSHWQPNAGRASACNAGLALAQGTIVVLLDDDMDPPPGFLEAHAGEHPAGSRRGVVGAAPVVTAASSPPAAEYIARKFNRHVAALAVPGRVFSLRDFYTGNFSIRRSILQAAGGFDTEFRRYGNEDLELSVRLKRAGVELAFSPRALAYQSYTKDFAALARDSTDKGRTAVLLAAKHPETRDELKLNAANLGSPLRRRILSGLTMMTGAWPGMPAAVVSAMSMLGRTRRAGLDSAYGVALDYFYLLGARAARQEAPSSYVPAGGRTT